MEMRGDGVVRRRREGLSRRAPRLAAWESVGKAAGKRETRCILPLRLDMVKRAAERCRRVARPARVGGRENEKI